MELEAQLGQLEELMDGWMDGWMATKREQPSFALQQRSVTGQTTNPREPPKPGELPNSNMRWTS